MLIEQAIRTIRPSPKIPSKKMQMMDNIWHSEQIRWISEQTSSGAAKDTDHVNTEGRGRSVGRLLIESTTHCNSGRNLSLIAHTAYTVEHIISSGCKSLPSLLYSPATITTWSWELTKFHLNYFISTHAHFLFLWFSSSRYYLLNFPDRQIWKDTKGQMNDIRCYKYNQ